MHALVKCLLNKCKIFERGSFKGCVCVCVSSLILVKNVTFYKYHMKQLHSTGSFQIPHDDTHILCRFWTGKEKIGCWKHINSRLEMWASHNNDDNNGSLHRMALRNANSFSNSVTFIIPNTLCQIGIRTLHLPPPIQINKCLWFS